MRELDLKYCHSQALLPIFNMNVSENNHSFIILSRVHNSDDEETYVSHFEKTFFLSKAYVYITLFIELRQI